MHNTRSTKCRNLALDEKYEKAKFCTRREVSLVISSSKNDSKTLNQRVDVSSRQYALRRCLLYYSLYIKATLNSSFRKAYNLLNVERFHRLSKLYGKNTLIFTIKSSIIYLMSIKIIV